LAIEHLPGRKVPTIEGPERYALNAEVHDIVSLVKVYRYLDGRRLRARLFLWLKNRLGRNPTPREMLLAARRWWARLDVDAADAPDAVLVRREETDSDDVVEEDEPDAEPHRWQGEPAV
jgi:hypothetical protein